MSYNLKIMVDNLKVRNFPKKIIYLKLMSKVLDVMRKLFCDI